MYGRALDTGAGACPRGDDSLRTSRRVWLAGCQYAERYVRPARYGVMAMRISMAVLVIALVVVAMLVGGRSSVLGVALEWVLCAELVATGAMAEWA